VSGLPIRYIVFCSGDAVFTKAGHGNIVVFKQVFPGIGGFMITGITQDDLITATPNVVYMEVPGFSPSLFALVFLMSRKRMFFVLRMGSFPSNVLARALSFEVSIVPGAAGNFPYSSW